MDGLSVAFSLGNETSERLRSATFGETGAVLPWNWTVTISVELRSGGCMVGLADLVFRALVVAELPAAAVSAEVLASTVTAVSAGVAGAVVAGPGALLMCRRLLS